MAVFVDATVVRSLLAPAAMKLWGNRNWYLPRWLHWLPDLRIEGDLTQTQPTEAPAFALAEASGDDEPTPLPAAAPLHIEEAGLPCVARG